MNNNLEHKIIDILNQDSRIPVADIAVMLGREEAEIRATIASLEAEGVIVKYNVVINDEKLHEENVQALIEVKVTPQRNEGFDAIAEQIMAWDEVKSLYLMSGTYDLMLIIEGKTLKEVAYFVSEKLSTQENILSTATHFILKRYKSNGVLLDGGQSENRLVVAP